MARQTIVSTQQAERITDRALRHIRPIFGKCYGYPLDGGTRRFRGPPSVSTESSSAALRPEKNSLFPLLAFRS
ncbi:hypothetical protein F1734_25655 (plasmid) [Rhodococcus ruber]|nr:hypothetical protein CQZ88_00380 [Rhodococcus sp. ENV425]QRE83718.1 hypothetical protein F1734_25655 [Rhodococcus ruber]